MYQTDHAKLTKQDLTVIVHNWLEEHVGQAQKLTPIVVGYISGGDVIQTLEDRKEMLKYIANKL